MGRYDSTMSVDTLRSTLSDMIDGQTSMKFLYTTPETLVNNNSFSQALQHACRMQLVSLVVIDEAHCVTSWDDFRPAYSRLGAVMRATTNMPIMALTATASDATIRDIKESLFIHEAAVVKAPMLRANLFSMHASKETCKFWCAPRLSALASTYWCAQ